MDLTGLIETGGQPAFEEAKEGGDCGEAGIPASWAVATLRFEMLKKSQDQRGIQMFNLKLVRLNF